MVERASDWGRAPPKLKSECTPVNVWYASEGLFVSCEHVLRVKGAHPPGTNGCKEEVAARQGFLNKARARA